jgi:hypothetical protein
MDMVAPWAVADRSGAGAEESSEREATQPAMAIAAVMKARRQSTVAFFMAVDIR